MKMLKRDCIWCKGTGRFPIVPEDECARCEGSGVEPPMPPSVVLLATVGVLVWFVGLPIAVAESDKIDCTLLEGFALIWGLTAAALLFVRGLVLLDRWWLRHHERASAP